jgi:hypothetical protein
MSAKMQIITTGAVRELLPALIGIMRRENAI